MFENFSGATRVHIIVGDPITQVKSPFGVTQAFEKLGKDAVCIPVQVPTKDLKQWFEGISLARNIDSIIVTVPHTPVGMFEQKDVTPRRVQTCSCKSANSWSSSC